MSTKGVWYPDRTKANERDPPLYLHISATSPEMLEKAITKVNDLINMDMGSLVEDKKDRMRERVCFMKVLILCRTYNSPAKMARREDPSRPRDDKKLQRPCQSCWAIGMLFLLVK